MAALLDPFPPCLCAVCGVEDGDCAFASPEPVHHVCDGSFCGCSPHLLAIFVVGVKEVGGGIRSLGAAVLADIEGLCSNGEPVEVANDCEAK